MLASSPVAHQADAQLVSRFTHANQVFDGPGCGRPTHGPHRPQRRRLQQGGARIGAPFCVGEQPIHPPRANDEPGGSAGHRRDNRGR